MKRFLSVFLSFVIVCSYFSCLAMTSVSALDSRVESAVQWALNIANDNSHGYSQLASRRWGNPDYDCSSLVITAFKNHGFNVGSATYTGNMRSVFVNAGFTWIPKAQINLSNSSQLQRGDILLNEKNHVEIYIGNNQRVGAHTGYIDIYDKNYPGDNTGNEISVYNYSNSSNWDGILRYTPQAPVDNYVDLGTDFYAYIINTAMWKHLTNDSPNVSIRTETGNANQVWKFDRQADGSYKITNCADGLVLDVHNFGTTDGTNVAVAENNDSTAQRWYIYGESGDYKLKAKCGNLMLDVNGGNVNSPDGTNVQMWNDNGTIAQKFQIWKLNKPSASYIHCAAGTQYTPTSIWWTESTNTNCYDLKIWNGTYWVGDAYKIEWGVKDTGCMINLPPGYYEAYVDSRNNYCATMSSNVIKFTVTDNDKPVDIGEDVYASLLLYDPWLCVSNTEIGVQLEDECDIKKKIWHFQKQSDGSYIIESYYDGKVLEVKNSADHNEADIIVNKKTGSDSQKWFIYGRWSGEYYLKPKCSNRVLDVKDGANCVGAKVQLYDLNYTNAQKYAIYQIELSDLHEHEYISTITKKSTCTTNGTITYTCSTCGDTYTEPIPATGHSWKSATCTAKKTCTTCGVTEGSALGHSYTSKVTKSATCTASGTKTFTCSRCNHSYTETIPATGHSWKSATCTAKKTCTTCGVTEGSALGHNYTSKVTKQPTCTASGIKTFSCSRCTHSYIETIPATGHSWKSATCTSKKTCSTCGVTEGSALGHNYTSKVTKQPTCTASGIKTFSCSRCTHSYTETIPATGHSWKSATCTSKKTCSTCGVTEGSALGHSYTSKVTKQATCTASGTKTFTCSRCTHSYTETIPATGHSWKSATCTTKKTCTTCGATEGSELGHNYTSKVTKQATCTASGTKTFTCSRCNHSYTETIPATGHSWKSATCTAKKTCTTCGVTEGSALGHSYTSKVTKQATCTTSGTKTFSCSRCNHSYTETIPAKGHTIVIDKPVPPTATESGLTQGEHCEVCGKVLIPQEIIKPLGITGDVDGDGKVTIKDSTTIQKHIADLILLDNEHLALSDANGDCVINISDSTQIQKYLADLIDKLG